MKRYEKVIVALVILDALYIYREVVTQLGWPAGVWLAMIFGPGFAWLAYRGYRDWRYSHWTQLRTTNKEETC